MRGIDNTVLIGWSGLLQGKKRQKQLTKLLGEYLLRRRKDKVIREQLPRKTDNIVLCQLTELQVRAYK